MVVEDSPEQLVESVNPHAGNYITPFMEITERGEVCELPVPKRSSHVL